MEMRMLLPLLVLLVGPVLTTPVTPHHKSKTNLNHLFDLAVNTSLPQGVFVEDVAHLAEGENRCEDKFFCKVHQILDAKNHDDRLVRSLDMYLKGRNVVCAEQLNGVAASGDTKPILDLIVKFTRCIQIRNMNKAP